MPRYDLRLPGLPSGLIRTDKELYIPSDGAAPDTWYGYGFDPFPLVNGARPVHAFTANNMTESAGDFSTAPNVGTAGGTWDVGASSNAPAYLATGLGGRPTLQFVRTNNEAIHTSSTATVTNPFFWMMVMDVTGTDTSVFWGASENAAGNGAQFFQSGANYRINSGVTRSDPGIDLDANVYWGSMGNPTTTSQLVKSDGPITELLGAGSTGTNALDGVSLGSNQVPETVNTMNGEIAYFAVWTGESGTGASTAVSDLVTNLSTYYSTA